MDLEVQMGTSRLSCAPYRGDWLSLTHRSPDGYEVVRVMGIEGGINLLVLNDHDIPIPCLRATKDHLYSSSALYRGAVWRCDVHATMQPLGVVYGMQPHPIDRGTLPLHR